MEARLVAAAICLALAFLWAGGSAQNIEALNSKLLQVNAFQKLYSDGGFSAREQLKAAKNSLSEGMTAFWFPDLESRSMSLAQELGNASRNISEECKEGAERIMGATDPTTKLPLIIRMIDAMGKVGAGYFDGNVYSTGAYDECFDIGAGFAEYCLGPLNLTSKTLPLQWPLYAFCVPKGCTPDDIELAVHDVTFGLVVTNASKIDCTSSKKPPFTAGAIVMIIVCFLFGLMVVGATLFDYIRKFRQERFKQSQIQDISEQTPLVSKEHSSTKWAVVEEMVTAFSLFKVLPQILSTKQPPSAITSINGLRVISMFWVILAHTHFFALETGLDNGLRLKATLSRFSFQAIGNAYFAVDSFFVLSGLLVAYLTMRQMKRKNGRFPVVTYYLHRYLRLTPTYAFVLFFIWILTRYLADGPIYHMSVGEESANVAACKKYWWTNLLYINNLYPWNLSEECIGWTWYLANDMQFYVLSPLILIPLYFILPLGVAISAVVIFVSIVISGTLAGIYDHQANQLAMFAYNYVTNPNMSADVSYNSLQYIKPWHRVSPYIVGLLLGYVLYRLRLTNTKRNAYFHYIVFSIMWVLSGIFLFTTLYGLYFTWHGHIPSKFENVLYIMLSRFVWSVGLALLVVICHYGYGGLVNSFLSMNFWIPLSRLSYNAYLLHEFILLVIFGSKRMTTNYQDYDMAIYAIGIVALSFGAAAVVSVFVEFPIGNLEQVLFKMAGLRRHESARTDGHKHKENIPNDIDEKDTKPVLKA